MTQIQLLVVETCAESVSTTPLRLLLQSFNGVSFTVQSLTDASLVTELPEPDLVLLHSNLTSAKHLQKFVQVHDALPHTGIVVVSEKQDKAMCLLALEAGADDSISEAQLTEFYLHKAVVLSRYRNRTRKGLTQSREQLLACLQNTPNVAVQWYNGRGEVLFWNHASERLYGWSESEAMGKGVDQLIVIPDNHNYWLEKMLQLKNTDPAVLTEEWSFTKRDGSEGCCLSTLFLLSAVDSEPLYVCMDVDITERHRMEKALRASEEKYYTLFNQASDAIFINMLEGQLLDVNQQACLLTGISKEKLLTMRVDELYDVEELAERPIMRRELATGQRVHIERNMTDAAGKKMVVEVTAQKMQDGRVMAIVRDVSERKKAEKALLLSEEKYRTLIEQNADATAIFDKDGRIVDVNGSATALLGYSKEELQHLTLADVLSKESLAANPVDFALLRTGVSTIKQRRMRRRNGSTVETEVHTKRLFDGLFLASVRDLTERIEVQHRLQKEIELSESIINSLPGLFYLFTQEGKYLRWNRRQEMLSGYSNVEIAGMKPLNFIADADKEAVGNAIDETFQTGYSAVEANFLTKAGESIPYYFTGSRVQYANTECLVGTGIDLTALKNLEQELSQQKIAEQKRLMQAMIDAEEKERHKLGLELHDNVNQILSVVRMYLSVLNGEEKIEGITLPKAMNLLNSAITEIRQLSHSLAVSYKFETGLTGSLEDMVAKVQAARGFDVRLSLPSQLDDLTTTRQKLAVYRIVQEQLNNVIKHANATEVRIAVSMAEKELRLTIADNGKGFDPANAKKGLGLNNIANRAEALAGRAVVASKPGEGTRLEVAIPREEV